MSSAGPGLFGKLPSHGDFITRRLARDFLDTWDEWLQSGVAASRSAMGEDAWLAAYLTAPVWCFALDAGICGKRGWAGILLPSVDRVGRYFPLTIAVELPAGVVPARIATSGVDWFERARLVALDVLEQETPDLEGFDKAVQDLGSPAVEPAPTLLVPPVSSDSPGLQLPLWAGGPGPTLQALAAGWLAAALSPSAVWWTDGSERVEPALLWSRGLPEPDAFRSYITGEWLAGNWLQSVPAERPAVTAPTGVSA